MSNSECFVDNFIEYNSGVSYDYGQLVCYVFTIFGILASSIIIITRNKYFKTNSGFGYLILAMGVCDFFVSFTWLAANFVDNSVQYHNCITNTTSTQLAKYWIANAYHINDVFLLASAFMGLAVSYIAISVLYLNAIANNIQWKRLIAACFAIPLVYWIVITIVYTVNFSMRSKSDQPGINLLRAQWNIFYNLVISIIASIVVALFILFYVLTTIGLSNQKSSPLNSSKTLMLNMIQAITISNMICWIPMIVFCATTAAGYMSDYSESDPVYYAILYVYNATASCKGLYHLISLYICERLCQRNAETTVKEEVDTIQWTPTKEFKFNFSLNDDTL
ncbi:hypothetical protein HK103_002024 [Boothiomyces macroporosus]|uniref:Uncharacterized protein n=1 Tax=Boothiomyces macroporosus TaxID=261099 RepID=A0AAD5Y2R9_9FUNG|nr:hypothetical protein HK103_002024 [Boothiomyces macroporosus]